MNRALGLLVSLSLALVGALPAEGADLPDYSDTYLPEIQSLSVQRSTSASVKGTDVEFLVDVTFRFHRNAVTSLDFQVHGGTVNIYDGPCSRLQSGAGHLVHDSRSSAGLVSRASVSDWYVERRQFRLAMAGATPTIGGVLCRGTYSLEQITLTDAAGRKLNIFYPEKILIFRTSASGGSTVLTGGTPLYAAGYLSSTFWNLSGPAELLPCNRLDGEVVDLENCNQSVDWRAFDFVVSPTATAPKTVLTLIDYPSLYEAALAQVKTLTAEKAAAESRLTSMTLEKAALEERLSTASAGADAATARAVAAELRVTTTEAELARVTAKLAKICAVKPKPKRC